MVGFTVILLFPIDTITVFRVPRPSPIWYVSTRPPIQRSNSPVF